MKVVWYHKGGSVRETLDFVIDQGMRCGRITRSILQFARQQPTEKWSTHLNKLVEHSVQLTRAYSDKNGAVLELRCADDLPAITVNPVQIEQVFVNLIRNAAEAVEPSGLVVVLTERTPSGVRGIVEDSGKGMTEDAKRRLFDPFFTTRRSAGGVGLGLSLSHGIVAEHGGTLKVEDLPSGGTRFLVDLPIESVQSLGVIVDGENTGR